MRWPRRLERVQTDAVVADRERMDNSKALDLRDAGAVGVAPSCRAAGVYELAASADVAAPVVPRPARALSESSAYQLADVKASAVDAGIPETVRAAGAQGVRTR